MTRIFPTLASLSLMLFVGAVVMGLSIGDLYDSPTEATLAWRGRHMLLGTAAALAVVFVECVVVTYFIGTSRWCKEVTEAYRLDAKHVVASNRLKRSAFPCCVTGMLAVVGIGALGAASDPGTDLPHTEATATYHLAAALGGACLIGWTYYRSWLSIVGNQEVIQRIVAEVRRIRRQRGLDTDEAEASSFASG
ncbi:MAG: hypothetical protein AAF961_16870 [Planctomycetota bacterium]